MKKLTAFLTALVLFLVSAAGMHFYAESRITVNNNAFSFWAIEKNLWPGRRLPKISTQIPWQCSDHPNSSMDARLLIIQGICLREINSI